MFNLDREKNRISPFFIESPDFFPWVSRFSFIRGWQVCDYEEKIVQYQRFIIKQRRAHSYPLHLVANMDESPIQFDMPSNRTVSKTGEKSVKIRTTGNEKDRLTVVLT